MIVLKASPHSLTEETETLTHVRENTGTIDFVQTFTKEDSRSSSLVAAMTEPDVINSCQSQLKSENWKIKKR